MPFHLAPISRRRFLATSAATGASLLTWRAAGADESGIDQDRVALLADTHIAADPATVKNDVNMFDHLRAVVEQLRAVDVRPGHAIVAGDCAFSHGEPGDYRRLIELLRPLREADLPVHLLLGNHDERDHFRAAFDADENASSPVEGKLVSVLETPRANWILLDSLIQTKVTPGLVGPAQRSWLETALDQRPDKPAIVVVHHHPTFGLTGGNGLSDTAAVFDILTPRKQVKAVVYGHTHIWRLGQHEGMHLVNLPPVSYVSGTGRPSGWVDARLGPRGMTLELRSLDTQHPEHGKRIELDWRT